MTPLQFAQRFCANYQPGGSCLGAWIADDGKITSCSPKPKCVLPARCLYFEECVAPNAERFPDHLAESAQEAVWTYRLGLPEIIRGMKLRRIRRCQCGTPLEPKKRFCARCRRARRRETWRQEPAIR